MKVRVRQAVFGEKDKGHRLLLHSGGPDPLFAEVKRFSDLPTHFPQGYEWRPYHTGVHYKDHLLLLKTFPDTASERTGMVCTHALIMDRTSLTTIADLGPFFDLLPSTARKTGELDELVVEVDPARSPTVEDPDRFLDAARSLVEGNGGRPVVWATPDGFVELVTTLWANMTRGMREEFSFGMTIAPGDLAERDLTLVHLGIPDVSKWTGFPVVSASGSEAAGAAAAMLVGDAAGSALREFVAAENIPLDSFEKLSLAETCFELHRTSGDPGVTFDQAATLVRLIGALCPAPECGSGIKRSAGGTLLGCIAGCSLEDLKRIRNLSTDGFGELRSDLVRAIADRFGSAFTAEAELPALRALLPRLFQDAEGPVYEGLRESLKEPPRYAELAPVVWRIWADAPDLFEPVSEMVPREAPVEDAFIRSRPAKLTRSGADAVIAWCAGKNWRRLAFLVSVAGGSPISDSLDSLSRQYGGKVPKRVLRGLFKELPGGSLVAGLAEAKIPELEGFAVETVIQSPETIGVLDARSAYAQGVLEAVFDREPATFSGVLSGSTQLGTLLDQVAAGRPVRQRLIRLVSETELADLSGNPRCEEILANVEPPAHGNFAYATARGHARKIAMGSDIPERIPPAVESILLGAELRAYILGNSGKRSPSVLVQIYRRFEGLDEDQFERDLIGVESRSSRVDFVDSDAIGELIADRSWGKSANRIAHDVLDYDRTDMIPAIKRCYDLLGKWNRFYGWLNGSFPDVKIGENEWWEILTDLVTELYREGPEDNEIWSRAGGSGRDLEYNGKSFQRWRRVLQDLRAGGGGKKITVRKLLECIEEDFPRNKKLLGLIRLRKSSRASE